MTGIRDSGIIIACERKQKLEGHTPSGNVPKGCDTMDLFITLIIILIIVLWSRSQVRYYLLLFAGIFILMIALIFAPVLLLSPLFYFGLAVAAVLMIYKVITRERHKGKK